MAPLRPQSPAPGQQLPAPSTHPPRPPSSQQRSCPPALHPPASGLARPLSHWPRTLLRAPPAGHQHEEGLPARPLRMNALSPLRAGHGELDNSHTLSAAGLGFLGRCPISRLRNDVWSVRGKPKDFPTRPAGGSFSPNSPEPAAVLQPPSPDRPPAVKLNAPGCTATWIAHDRHPWTASPDKTARAQERRPEAEGGRGNEHRPEQTEQRGKQRQSRPRSPHNGLSAQALWEAVPCSGRPHRYGGREKEAIQLAIAMRELGGRAAGHLGGEEEARWHP